MPPSSSDHPGRLARRWYLIGAAFVLLILIVGGITRLTRSGLSIVEWAPVTGVLPPLSDEAWNAAFDDYKAFPEFSVSNPDMTIQEFKRIFFWEYLHRLLARMVGLVFLIQFVWLWRSPQADRTDVRRSAFLFGLVLLQGFMGWFMVQSGLVDIPRVSPYRLAIHLLLAFSIFGFSIWFALDSTHPRGVFPAAFGRLKRALTLFSTLLAAQLFWGALVAGNKAGYAYPTFPTLSGHWIPPETGSLFESVPGVQIMHRLIGTLLLLSAAHVWIRTRLDAPSYLNLRRLSYALVALISLQYLTGVFTLLLHMPIPLAAFHQASAMVLTGLTLAYWHAAQSSHS
jgi:cytochrome c oxidase assembly protein subunit 15